MKRLRVSYKALTLKHNAHPANTKGAALTPAVNTKENTAIPTADTKEATSSTHFISSQWKRMDLNRRPHLHPQQTQGPLLQQLYKGVAATQGEAAATAITRGGRCCTREGCNFSHNKYKEAIPQQTKRPLPQ